MCEYLFHDSFVPGIRQIHASSVLHGTEDTRVVYLTGSRAYALFYIWDAGHNIRPNKHVTAWIKNGTVYYEEQFPQQLTSFYKGVSGYVYYVKHDESFCPVEEHESMWYGRKDADVAKVDYIADVYDEICRYEKSGIIKIIRYSDVPLSRLNDLYSYVSERILSRNLLHTPEAKDALFYQTYFKKAWEAAVEKDRQSVKR